MTLIKICLALVFIVLMNIQTITIFKVGRSHKFQTISTQCLFDLVLEGMMKPSNLYLKSHPTLLKVAIIVSSLTIDLVSLFILGFFIIYAKSPRVFYSIIMFYTLRAICQANFLFEYPKGNLFQDPGFFSLFVPYGLTSDYYFSGHSGFLFMTTLELIQMKMVLLAFFNFLSTLFTAWMLCATQGPYSIGTES